MGGGAVTSPLTSIAGRVEKRNRAELVSALRIIQIWAATGEPKPGSILRLCKKVLGTKALIVCKSKGHEEEK
jgi:hypothetical protein